MIEKEKYIQFEDLNKYDNIIHFHTKKPFNFNYKKIDRKIINSEYEELEKIIGNKFSKIIKPLQMHTNIVKVVDENNIDDEFENVDGLITNLKGVALVTSLADCQGILLFDPVKNVIGNVHSGWKGTVNKIVENAVKLMKERFNCDPQNIKAYISPSILKECFEVDEDVKDEFVNNFSDINISKYIEKKNNKYYIDTVSINKEVMNKNGILNKNIICSNICTKCNSDKYHSYRNDKITDGRNIAFIMIK